MPSGKELLRKKFSAEPDKYYRVALFDELGFVRKQCAKCGGYFWTLDESRVTCPEQPCQQYEFLGAPATNEKVEYVRAWQKVESFFKRNGHQPVARYPVVCRWRPDLYFTIASIVDFQRIELGKVVFDFPFNPLIVPQICLRFSDIANVGVTGRHYTSFCMIGQHALANPKGYWKDTCVELDYRLLTEEFGFDKNEVVFKEDVWLGPGAFGNSLEYYVRGLELGNCVFTGFEGTIENYKEYSEKVIDMGAGLERFVWATQGTFNSYDAVFSSVLQMFQKKTGIGLSTDRSLDGYFKLAGSLDIDRFKGAVADYSTVSKQLGLDEIVLRRKIQQIQAIYSLIDHSRTLLFGISDGMLPGNVGGGYNLRVILRRSLDFINDLAVKIDLVELASWHAESLKDMYPELSEHIQDVGIVLDVEEKKYAGTRDRTSKIIETLSKKKQRLGAEKLAELYDSEGITPDVLNRAGLDLDALADFYDRITSRHMIHRDEIQGPSYDVSSIPGTRLIFYEDGEQHEFRANVLKVLSGGYVALDSTAFYARAGGQEPDHGTLDDLAVDDVIKVGNVILHHVNNFSKLTIGDSVIGIVDSKRRSLITRHHTATHIINGASRKVLGPWVWQHSAFKDIDMGRLDITHFAHLSRDQILEIERVANAIVRKNLPVTIAWFPRSVAEQKYGFRLYQGGAAPVKDLRIVNIEGFDVEACGGTHVRRTGEVGLIKIIKSERVQDGVERLEYVAGEVAISYIEKQESILLESSGKLETPLEKLSASISNLKVDTEHARKIAKQLAKRLSDFVIAGAPGASQEVSGIKLYSSIYEEGLDSEYHLIVGDKLSKTNPEMVYVAIFKENSRSRIIVFSGDSAQKRGARAGPLVREIAKSIGGSGGGDSRFAQGGADSEPEQIPDLRAILLNAIGSR